MYWHSLVLLLLFSLYQNVVLSANITVYRNKASSGGDQVENKDCNQQECTNIGTTCASAADGGCCRCECPSLKPNFVVGKGVCLSNDEVKTQLNSDCKYDLSPAFADLLLTTQSSGEKDFNSKHVVFCDFAIEARTWENLNSKAEWQKGVGDVFSVKKETVALGPADNDYNLLGIKWSSTLNNQYAGTIIRINITCGKELGCVLAKVTGQKTYDTENPQPPPTPSQPTSSPTTTPESPTTNATTTTESPTTTTTTTESPTTTTTTTESPTTTTTTTTESPTTTPTTTTTTTESPTTTPTTTESPTTTTTTTTTESPTTTPTTTVTTTSEQTTTTAKNETDAKNGGNCSSKSSYGVMVSVLAAAAVTFIVIYAKGV